MILRPGKVLIIYLDRKASDKFYNPMNPIKQKDNYEDKAFDMMTTEQTSITAQMTPETFPAISHKNKNKLKSLLDQLLDMALSLSGAPTSLLIIARNKKVTFCARNARRKALPLSAFGINEKDIPKLSSVHYIKNISFSSSDKVFRCYPIRTENATRGVLYLENAPMLNMNDILQVEDYIMNHISLAISHFEKQNQLKKVVQENEILRQNIVQNDNLLVKGTAAAKLGHEFNNYLSGLRANIDVVLQNMQKEQHNQENYSRLSRTQKIIDDMNMLSKTLLDRNRFEPLFKSIGLNDLVDNFTDFIKPIYKQEKVAINTELQPNLPPVNLDPGLMLQVLFNLVKNAVEARPDATVHIQTKVDEEHSEVQLIVSDNGPGIEEKEFNNIFSDEMKSKSSGHGYGLLICKEIIDKHSGKLSVQSMPGQGTQFVISLKSCRENYGEIEFDELEKLRKLPVE